MIPSLFTNSTLHLACEVGVEETQSSTTMHSPSSTVPPAFIIATPAHIAYYISRRLLSANGSWGVAPRGSIDPVKLPRFAKRVLRLTSATAPNLANTTHHPHSPSATHGGRPAAGRPWSDARGAPRAGGGAGGGGHGGLGGGGGGPGRQCVMAWRMGVGGGLVRQKPPSRVEASAYPASQASWFVRW